MQKTKAIVMDEASVERALTRMAYEILERNKGTDHLVLIGIKRRGTPLARILADNLLKIEGVRVPVEEIDITPYRDDQVPTPGGRQPCISLQCTAITGMHCVLVDDVLYTGRTVRSAMDALIAKGRPQSIRLAVLIDRGHRELPIHADFIGKHVPTSHTEAIGVRVPEYDACLDVILYETDLGKLTIANPVIL
jgi:pyrimidine operon attenuation protein/uracil phosphoribosyltransferase